MRKICITLLCLLMIIPCCHADSEAKYEARANIDFHLRNEVDGNWILSVPNRSTVSILEWGEQWCQIEFDGVIGYCKTDWLYYIRSLDAMKYSLPNIPIAVTGYATFQEDSFVAGGSFKGLTAQTGQIACVAASDDARLILPVWRDRVQLSADISTYSPFTNWPDAQSGDIIGGFTTFYGPQQGKGLAEAREYNILLGAERIDGHVIKSGDSFSFNALCGPYKKSNGYKLAPNISAKGTGFGGGVCQVTTTLYNALLTLPLQIHDWAIHQYSGIVYAPQFFDAAVGSTSDLVFENTLPYAIKIQVLPQNGMLTVLICRA